ncbi:hypothetical protein CRM22_009014 [Opisthorchis felineus]|nr:hypothetical protein CRM22_009014 [Opisthorchis felineus]TGZ59513.1 hypothetical protein CRM22_009014 [Opisthorchis felineus]
MRILVQTVLDPAQIKDAERIGALFSLLHSALCTQLLEHHHWFTGCNLERYHISQSPPILTTALLSTRMSAEAERSLKRVQNTEVKSFIINQILQQDFMGIQTAVDVHRDGIEGENENIPHKDDRVQQYATEMRLYIQVDGDSITSLSGDICREAIDVLRTDLEAQLTATMAEKGRQVNVVYQTVLNYDHRKVVKFLVYHVSVIPTVEIAFPEKWKVGLQGVIDSLGLATCYGTNFQVPLFQDQSEFLKSVPQ